MVALFAIVVLPAGVVRAAAVAIVLPGRSSPAWNETVSRLHGELLSVGAEVHMVDGATRAKSVDARAWFLELATQRGLDAIIDIVGDEAPVTVEVWVKGKAPGQFEVSRVDLDPSGENASERSAIRALEVLRSIFLEIDLASRARKTTAPPSPPPSPPPARPAQELSLEVGAATLSSPDGVGLALLPMARAAWAPLPWFAVQAALAGRGTRPTVSTSAGSAAVAQDFGMLGACYRWRATQRVRPLVGLSVGALHTLISGRAEAPKLGHSERRWALLFDGSVGMAVRIYGHAQATVAAHVQWTEPSVSIHFIDQTVASTGRPNLMLSLTLGAWL